MPEEPLPRVGQKFFRSWRTFALLDMRYPV
jgi:hypothetical protein